MPDVIYMPSCAAKKWLEVMLGLDLQENALLKLFTNDITITDDTVAGDFTEMAGLGYAAKTLSMSSWGAPTWDGVNKKAVSVYAEQEWVFEEGTLVNVRGWYLVMATTGTLLLACKFAAAKPIQHAGETISVTPQHKYGLKAAA